MLLEEPIFLLCLQREPRVSLSQCFCVTEQIMHVWEVESGVQLLALGLRVRNQTGVIPRQIGGGGEWL